MKQLALAVLGYVDAKGMFPPAVVTRPASGVAGAYAYFQGTEGPPWQVLILPQLEEQARYDSFTLTGKFGGVFNHEAGVAGVNATPQKTRNVAFLCPTSPHGSLTSGPLGLNGPNAGTNYVAVMGGGPKPTTLYCPGFVGQVKCDLAVWGPTTPTNDLPCRGRGYRPLSAGGVMFLNSKTRFAQISDGTSKSFLLGETRYGQLASGYNWSNGAAEFTWASAVHGGNGGLANAAVASFSLNTSCDPVTAQCVDHFCYAFGSFHAGGAQFVMADGSVHFLNDTITPTILRSLGQCASGDGTLP